LPLAAFFAAKPHFLLIFLFFCLRFSVKFRRFPKGWRVFCREVEFFLGGARAGRMTALAKKIFRGGVSGANTTTPTVCVGQKTERNCKKRDSPTFPKNCPTKR
jgi:hypothetical protein